MKKFILYAHFIVVCNTVLGQAIQSGISNVDSILNDLEAKIQREINTNSLDGSVSIAVVYKNQIIRTDAIGFSDKANNIPADTSAIYRIGSITKSFTAFAMMQLVEQGALRLTDPVELYVPEIKQLKGYNESHKITFLQLATHTSGLARDPPFNNTTGGTVDNWESKLLESIPVTLVKTIPGKRFLYSNIGYSILGLAISRAAKKPYITLIEENIFYPLQMNNSFFVVPADKISKLAEPLNTDADLIVRKRRVEPEKLNFGNLIPCGGIFSTASDLSKFMIACLGFRSLLNDTNRRLMQTGQVRFLSFFKRRTSNFFSVFLPRKYKNYLQLTYYSKYGIGFLTYDRNHLNIAWHGGNLQGYTSQIAFEKNSQYGIVLLRNYDSNKNNLQDYAAEFLSKINRLSN